MSDTPIEDRPIQQPEFPEDDGLRDLETLMRVLQDGKRLGRMVTAFARTRRQVLEVHAESFARLATIRAERAELPATRAAAAETAALREALGKAEAQVEALQQALGRQLTGEPVGTLDHLSGEPVTVVADGAAEPPADLSGEASAKTEG